MAKIKMLKTVMLPRWGKIYAGKEYEFPVNEMEALVANRCAVWLEQPVAAIVDKVPEQEEAVTVTVKRRGRPKSDAV